MCYRGRRYQNRMLLIFICYYNICSYISSWIYGLFLVFLLVGCMRAIRKRSGWPTHPVFLTRNRAMQALDWIIFFSAPHWAPFAYKVNKETYKCMYVCVRKKFSSQIHQNSKIYRRNNRIHFSLWIEANCRAGHKEGPTSPSPFKLYIMVDL